MVTLGEKVHHTDEKSRKPYADCLNFLIDQQGQNSIKNPTSESKSHFDSLSEQVIPEALALVASLANRIKVARNDLNHAGFRKHPMQSESIHNSAITVGREMEAIPLPPSNPAP